MVTGTGALNPVEAFAIVGLAGVGAQWLAWRFKMPGIVLMLVAGLLLGPVTGIFIPERDIGELQHPMISLAVAVILFEGGLTLNFHRLGDARPGVRRRSAGPDAARADWSLRVGWADGMTVLSGWMAGF